MAPRIRQYGVENAIGSKIQVLLHMQPVCLRIVAFSLPSYRLPCLRQVNCASLVDWATFSIVPSLRPRLVLENLTENFLTLSGTRIRKQITLNQPSRLHQGLLGAGLLFRTANIIVIIYLL